MTLSCPRREPQLHGLFGAQSFYFFLVPLAEVLPLYLLNQTPPCKLYFVTVWHLPKLPPCIESFSLFSLHGVDDPKRACEPRTGPEVHAFKKEALVGSSMQCFEKCLRGPLQGLRSWLIAEKVSCGHQS